MNPNRIKGFIALVIAQSGIGANVVIGKYLLDYIPIYFLLGCRFFISTVVATIIWKFSKEKLVSHFHPQGYVTKYDWGLLFLQGFFAGFLFNYLFLTGLNYTTATSGGIIGSTIPAIIAVSAFLILKEPLTKKIMFSIVLAIIGVLIISLNNPHGGDSVTGSFWGDFLIFLAMFPEAWYSIIGKALANRISSFGNAAIVNGVAFLCFLPFLIITMMQMDLSAIEPIIWLFILGAAMSSLIFFTFWPWGLKFVPASQAALFGGLMPISTTFFAVLFLSERFTWYDALGMTLVLSSIYVGTSKRKKKQLKPL